MNDMSRRILADRMRRGDRRGEDYGDRRGRDYGDYRGDYRSDYPPDHRDYRGHMEYRGEFEHDGRRGVYGTGRYGVGGRDHGGDYRSDMREDYRGDMRGDYRGDMRGDYRGDMRGDYRGDMRGDSRRDYGEEMKLSRSDLKRWKHMLKNADGTEGEHFTNEQMHEAIHQVGAKFDTYDETELCLTANMLYSDLCEALHSMIPKEREAMIYAKMAKCWLEDEDGPPGAEKLALYYYCIVDGDE